jgi:hypothetical protein
LAESNNTAIDSLNIKDLPNRVTRRLGTTVAAKQRVLYGVWVWYVGDNSAGIDGERWGLAKLGRLREILRLGTFFCGGIDCTWWIIGVLKPTAL